MECLFSKVNVSLSVDVLTTFLERIAENCTVMLESNLELNFP